MTKAVIYCRVSTEDEIQLNALEKQVEEAKLAVVKNGWVLADTYVDEGKSGTITRKRDEYNRLFQDLETDKFEIVVIKSQDRLMRSTKDWYIFIDKLVQNKKRLFFYLENSFYSSDDALITGIKAILAEEYSRELSKKMNNAHRHRQERKGTVLITSNTWGYDKVGKEIVINEKEAEIVRLIFDLCAQGYGTRTISKTLTNQGIFSRSGKTFEECTVRKIIRNPLFKGIAVMNKVHYDFNTKKSIINDPSEWLYNENVPPIVSEELWETANRFMDERTMINHSDEFGKKVIGKKKGDSVLSGKIICGECGSTYWRTRYRHADGEIIINWCCSEYVRIGKKTNRRISQQKVISEGRGCDNVHIKEKDLNDIIMQIAEGICDNKGDILQEAMNIISSVLSNSSNDNICDLNDNLNELQKKRDNLLDKFLDGMIDDVLYKRKDKMLTEQIENTKLKISEEMSRISGIKSEEERLKEIQSEIRSIISYELAFDFVCKHITNIFVYPDSLTIKYDVFPENRVRIERINYRKIKYQLV